MHDTLNKRQREAVDSLNGPLLIVAGAGAGKTKTLTHRIMHLIEKGVAPHKILSITFTNKAAKEMRERMDKLLSSNPILNLPISSSERPFMSTFHGLGVHILKTHAPLIGISKNFNILDRGDSKKIIKESLERRNLDIKEYEPGTILNIISKEKGNFVTEKDYGNRTHSNFEEIVHTTWKDYEASMLKESALDFDDLLLKTASLLTVSQEVREYYWSIWSHVHIDEYQDTNKVQYIIAKTLAEKTRNICVVGDVDQTIYSWRGADIRNILNFEKDYPEAKTILLEENYRSTKTIIAAANAVIQKNIHRTEKNLFTNNEDGEKISLQTLYTEVEEAYSIADIIKDMIQNKNVSAGNIAVLYRANFQSRVLEEAMLRKNVPYQVLGTKFFERKEVKDILSMLKLAYNRESSSNLVRAINLPPRGIGKVTIAKMVNNEWESIPAGTKAKIDAFFTFLDEVKAITAQKTPAEVIKFAIIGSGLEAHLKNGSSEDIESLENIKELVSLATKYDSVTKEKGGNEAMEAFLTEVSLMSDQDELTEHVPAVRLMTVHASKGLEFDYVFIAGMEEDLFPYARMGDEKKSKEESEEERRLFYVALTRARKRVFLSGAQLRTLFGSQKVNMPSQFLSDIDEDLLEVDESLTFGTGMGSFGNNFGRNGGTSGFGSGQKGEGLGGSTKKGIDAIFIDF